jgi:hypothetical protein
MATLAEVLTSRLFQTTQDLGRASTAKPLEKGQAGDPQPLFISRPPVWHTMCISRSIAAASSTSPRIRLQMPLVTQCNHDIFANCRRGMAAIASNGKLRVSWSPENGRAAATWVHGATRIPHRRERIPLTKGSGWQRSRRANRALFCFEPNALASVFSPRNPRLAPSAQLAA